MSTKETAQKGGIVLRDFIFVVFVFFVVSVPSPWRVSLEVVGGWTAVAAFKPSQEPLVARVEIDAARIEGSISPLLYGQFLEYMFEGVKRGLHAELIRNRSFEEPPNAIGLSRYWERYPDDRNDDYSMSFSWDDTTAYPNAPQSEGLIGGHSLRIQLRSGVVVRHGVYQARVPIERDLEYFGYVWMKTDAFKGDVRVALEADGTDGRLYDEARITEVTGDWKRYVFTLRPSTTDPLARFSILFAGSGTLWLDQISLLPGSAMDGVRADVFAKVKALEPAFIRWPGGNVAQDYHWRWGIGPRDERPTWINLSWKNEPEPSDFGTDEFIRFARSIGAEPSITVNVEGRGATVDEAASWVEYCNGAATTTSGTMRARNGHAEPYGVKYWEIGNEIWGDWVRGHSDAETYAHNFMRYAAAMRTIDPSIQLIAVGDNNMTWNRTVLQLAGEHIDYLAVHHYYGRREMNGDLRNLMARPLHYERWYDDVASELSGAPRARPAPHPAGAERGMGVASTPARRIRALGAPDPRATASPESPPHASRAVGWDWGVRRGEAPRSKLELPADRRPRLAINEWGLDLPEPQQYSIVSALYTGRLMNVFERRSDLIAMSAVSDLVNGWPGGIIQASDRGVFVTPIFLVNKLYATHLGADRLATTVDGPTFSTSREGNDVPVLDAVASRAADGRIFLKIVNTDLERRIRARVHVRGAEVSPRAMVERVVANSLTAANGFATPDAVRITSSSINARNTFDLELPEHSVSVVTLTTVR